LDKPNIFCCKSRNASPFLKDFRNASPFLKGFLCVAQATKIGYRWKYENGRMIRFWEEQF
jgi:hypothetical protein